MIHPYWFIQILRHGIPTFASFSPYISTGSSLQQAAGFVGEQLGHQVSLRELQAIRDSWPGKLVVKGILHPSDAELAIENGDEVPLFIDSGVRSGLDVLRALTLGADFVFSGRPFFTAWLRWVNPARNT